MKANILHILQGGRGGTLEYLKLLIPLLDKDKYSITVICHGDTYHELKSMNIKVFKLEMTRTISPINDLKSLLSINNYINKNHVDLIHAHSSKAGFLGRSAAAIHKIPCVYNPHGWSFDMKTNKSKTKLYETLERVASNWANKIILISPAELESALEKKISRENKFAVINNGIDLSKYSSKVDYEFRKLYSIKDNERLIGMCARFTPQKSPETFIEIAKYVTDRNPNCRFMLVGDGELRYRVEVRIKKLNLNDKVILTGWTNSPEKFINIFDIGVLTSRWEGFGLVLAEYMACGKPVVASRVGGIPYVVRGEIDGFLCDPNDIEGFGNCILKLLSDKSLYDTVAKNAIERVDKQFSIERVAREHELIYDQLLKVHIK